MAQLWGGRFEKGMDDFVYKFNASILFDSRCWQQDIRGSLAHVTMLGHQGILTEDETKQIIDGLHAVAADIESGKIVPSLDYEDVHSMVEAELIKRIGDVGKKLHTGRSRNDQAVTDVRLYLRDAIGEIRAALTELIAVLNRQMGEHLTTWMPGFTHMQKAQAVTLAHHLSAYIEMFLRDDDRLEATAKRMNRCPLGSAALAGTTYPLDRELSAHLLDFDGPTRNSMDSVSDRDHVCELAFDLSVIAMHLSRLSEEIITWNSDEYRFIVLDDSFCTGSSIMPQKKNPDIAELIRGKTGRVYGALISELTMMKGLPLAFNKDMQEDKEVLFDAIDTVKDSLLAMTGMMDTATFRKDRMERSARFGFIDATDVADYLVRKGIPFRDAHEIVGKLVLRCIADDKSLSTLPLESYRQYSPVFEEDIYAAIELENCVRSRTTYGGPSPDVMAKAHDEYTAWVKAHEV